ncbi:hypothetical protein EJ05DRAFT_510697 [Pseudovirgaria hyperparasitica]|uniref:Cell surface spherulin 4-like protein n=1 Tax=Pseudovirgaria hyperparasitica TaxID=470096 RepID=A0A6A6W9I2_9PEZI|nr:uncharacterized protein EJ05DRAFT_510697 [Pseudovirgaria hyperparasitica]KAF2758819.1 hypothetical protein EJ05DRAFT_510697 [Pseudovirgaria hyperparasitica]
MAPPPSVFVPLYIYPNPGAWDQLYQAAWQYPDLDFTVVVNPHSGPGSSALPDANYTREIPKLNEFDNVRTLGYVATDYGSKALDLTLAEIAMYAAWAEKSANMTMDGVFFDETPTHYDANADAYMQAVSTAVQESDGFGESFVVHNPGYIPDQRYMAYADLTVVFEQTYSAWMEMGISHQLDDLNYNKRNLVSLVHSLPDITEESLKCLADHLQLLTGHVFLTSLDSAYYQSFSPQFGEYVALLSSIRGLR